MDKTKIIILSLILISFFSLTVYSSNIKTIYQANKPIDIETKLGTQTVLTFETDIEFASVGNSEYFDVQTDATGNKLIIVPKQKGINTNLVVITKDNNEYVFTVNESENDKFISLGRVKPSQSIDYQTIISVLNGNRISPDSDIISLFEFYDIHNNKIVESDNLIVNIHKGAIIDNLDQTIYWFKLRNRNKESVFIETIGLENRALKAVATSLDKQELKKGETANLYLFAEGRFLNDNLILDISTRNNNYSMELNNIDFNKSKMQMLDIN